VYMPKGSAEERLRNIQREGAEASITDLNYDDAVRLAAAKAREHGWVVIQDTAWEGYTDIPLWIMQGYATMAMEACQQLSQGPTHVFLQAGVGSLAAAVQAIMVNFYPDTPPKVVIVEPNAADCIYKSFAANDGTPKFVGGDMMTIMAGLACGEPNIIGCDILRNYSEMGFSCPDWVSARGMRILGNPIGDDKRVISGESGAVTTGLVSLLMTDPALDEVRRSLGLDAAARVLVFSTEGDTDPNKYRSIVWDGECQSKLG
jgi:diaminopropionate ammonia-lyase